MSSIALKSGYSLKFVRKVARVTIKFWLNESRISPRFITVVGIKVTIQCV